MSEGTIVWFAGIGWDQIIGTDKRIVTHLAKNRSIVWIDPPASVGRGRFLLGASPPERVAPGVIRVRVTVLPGVTRWGIRRITAVILEAAAARILSRLDRPTVVVAFPLARFPKGETAIRLLFATDDWLEGAHLMGFSPAVVRRTLMSNLSRAHGIAAVTPALLDQLVVAGEVVRDGAGNAPARVIANGAPEPSSSPVRRTPVAGLVGQINERLDLSLLEEVVERGVPLRIIGPRTDRDRDFGNRLDRLLSAPRVEWLGAVPAGEIPDHLGRLGVGLTPYADTPFNRASFPLKTLEYLAAGLRAVSSDLPASRWIDSPHVIVRQRPEEFASAVVAELALPTDASRDEQCRQVARSHSWEHRADDLLELIAVVRTVANTAG